MTPVSPAMRSPSCLIAVSSSCGVHELVPPVSAPRHPAQDVFGAHDGEREAFARAIECGDEQQAAGLHHCGRMRNEHAHIGDMLDHLHGEDDVEAFAGRSERFSRRRRGNRWQDRPPRHAPPPPRCSRPTDRPPPSRAEAGQRLAQNAATASDIEETQAREAAEARRLAAEMLGRKIADISQPDRIEFVQGRHRPTRVPPLAGQAREAGNLVAVDGFGPISVWVHAKACSLGHPL